MSAISKKTWSSDTKEFLRRFPGRQCFSTIGADGRVSTRHTPCRLSEDMQAFLERQNLKGAGIYFTPNELNPELDEKRDRTAKMVVRARAFFLDDDIPREAHRGEEFSVEPSLIVETSRGKFHYYWLIREDESLSLEHWKHIQERLVVRLEGDKAVKDLSRIMRLPGFEHKKSGQSTESFTSTWMDTGSRPSIEDIEAGFGVGGFFDNAGVDDPRDYSDRVSVSSEETMRKITAGVDLHESLLSLSYQMMQEGATERATTLMLQGLMQAADDSVKNTDRWQERYDDIERLVWGVKDKKAKVDGGSADSNGLHDQLSELESETPEMRAFGLNQKDPGYIPMDEPQNSESSIPWPPGKLGTLCRAAYDAAPHAYKEVAIVSALGLLAGICGRRFNVSGAGLNLYLTLIMQSGMGKDSIQKFISRTLLELDDLGESTSFLGPERFTGPKAVVASLEAALSQVCVFTEAGLLLKSTAGDTAGLARSLLSLYGKSGYGSRTGGEMYSDKARNIKQLFSPALSIVSEATPETLLEAFSDNASLERGEVPRQNIFRVHGDKPNLNFKCRFELPKDVRDKIRFLISTCCKIQSAQKYEVIDVAPSGKIEKSWEDFFKITGSS